jgi:hypothetical protein
MFMSLRDGMGRLIETSVNPDARCTNGTRDYGDAQAGRTDLN